jgi:translation initiation factor 5A
MGSIPAKEAKKGHFIMIDDEPCKVLSLSKSKTGRHGSTKVRIEAEGIFDNKKKVILKPGSAMIEVPMINKRSAQVISVTGDIVQLMDLEDYSTFDASIPENLKGKLDSGTSISYWKVGNKIILKDLKG